MNNQRNNKYIIKINLSYFFIEISHIRFNKYYDKLYQYKRLKIT